MSHFYSYIQGGKGSATRCGNKVSGITASAQGWEGSLTVNQWYNDEEDCDYYSIQVMKGSGVGGRTIKSGPISELLTGVMK